ncbi:MauE/DoxX family redox-associated membrane protein [Pedobacter alluvionis]|uniref:Tellurium resistance protein TerC n=1 Tax=Pedobacter alluvionis TaxID=475253 RepID=A0A497XY35_9SPHI|nr:MauE/DoxX family redox-associated membrane protein [Pedobacter alluvionis]RLJ75120.1 hypothetical protein BCL90_3468 [Pedobacter alluvionis]TFB30224.1 tellurium resistance protein TerC [Pedobacter alluvionis]
MKKKLQILPSIIAYFFVLLFCYASVSKILDFENFQLQLAQSPLLSAYAGFISYAVIVLELLISFVLLFEKSRNVGVYASTALMSAFTIYIFLILNYSDFVPCSCGGILEKLGWTEHLIFNIICVFAGFLSLILVARQEQHLFKRTLLIIVSTNILSILLVIFLFISSEDIIKHENNFTRRFLLYPVVEDKIKNLDHDQYYFAGNDGKHIYLGNKSYPQRLTTVDYDLNVITQMRIIPDSINHLFKNLRLQVLYPYYFLYDGTVPVIYRGKVGSRNAETISYKEAYFSQMIPLDSGSFVVRTMNRDSRQLSIASFDIHKEPKIKLFDHILEKQADGVFDSDGQLAVSENPRRPIYLYSYRNQFLTIDHQFKVKKKLNTIDTISKAKVQITSMSDGRHKMSAPPLKVNQNIAAYGNLALIQSELKGKFESSEEWKKAKVMDIYRTDRQEYIGSFHIFNRRKKAMSDYDMTDQYLFVIIGNELIRHKYRKPLTDYLNRGSRKPDPRVGTH